MTILAIDPGPTETALLEWRGDHMTFSGILHNGALRDWLTHRLTCAPQATVAVEMIASYGMAVGKEVFETCLQIGRIQEIAFRQGSECRLVYRLQVKQHLCHDSRAKDSNIRQALIDRFGPPGVKKSPGILYGVKSHLWAALAVAVYAYDTQAA